MSDAREAVASATEMQSLRQDQAFYLRSRGVIVLSGSGNVEAHVTSLQALLGELPDQSTFDNGTPFLKCVDPRWHMGARILRPAALPESYAWGSEKKWAGHAMKLGFLPGTDLLSIVNVSPPLTVVELGLHALGLVDPGRLSSDLQEILAAPQKLISRRLLPLRLEPSDKVFSAMAGHPVTAGDVELGKVVAHEGLFGLVLVNLASWRAAQAAGQVLRCCEQQVLITWPSWLAQESLGRGGPVALARD